MTARDAELAAEIDMALIDRVVRAFYARIRTHEVLGPIFGERITDWEPHFERMNAFWGSVMHVGEGRYQGQPMQKHQTLPVDARHFDLWLDLFTATVNEVCPGPAASLFIERSRRIARSLELGLALAHGELLAWGERYRPAPANPVTGSGPAPSAT
jgi:hemoglobin